ncbi:MAG: fibronectin type III domain-containing protein [Carboxylicivirga sp.]|nr:fibronectin type III domain-containing protein [Carboxylicivirga sp.]
MKEGIKYNSAKVTWTLRAGYKNYTMTVVDANGKKIIDNQPITPTISGSEASYSIKDLDPETKYKITITVEKEDGTTEDINLKLTTATKPSVAEQASNLLKEIQKSLGIIDEDYKRVQATSEVVDKAQAVVESISGVTDGIEKLNSTLKKVITTSKVFKSLPVVGSVSTLTYVSAKTVQTPVGKVCLKIDAMKEPTIDPIENAVNKTKESVDNIKDKVSTGQSYLKTAEAIVGNKAFNNLVDSNEDAEFAMEELAKYMGYMNDVMQNVNNSVKVVEGEAAGLTKFEGPFSDIKNGMKATKSALDKVKPGLDKLDDAMSHKIRYKKKVLGVTIVNISFSVKDILNKVGGLTKYLNILTDKVADYLKDILKDVGVNIPEVPGLDKLENQLDALKQVGVDAIKAEITKLNTLSGDIAKYQSEIKKNLTILEDLLMKEQVSN